MYRLVPYIPILRVFFYIKNAKKMCICEYIIFNIDTFLKIVFLFAKRV